jgi:pyruvate ferredoxin oxidoreductase gamma subunit
LQYYYVHRESEEMQNMAKEMTEIRWHARGGQGAKTAATLVAAVVLEEGKYGQGFPDYGPERMGAPIRGYTRISDKPIREHSGIYTPDVVVVLDPTLLDSVDVCEGLVDDGVVLVNTPDAPADVRKKLGIKHGRVYTVDARAISLKEIGRDIPNTPMMGALVKIVPIIKLETIINDVKKKFGSKGERIVQGNMRAIQRAYEEVRSE